MPHCAVLSGGIFWGPTRTCGDSVGTPATLQRSCRCPGQPHLCQGPQRNVVPDRQGWASRARTVLTATEIGAQNCTASMRPWPWTPGQPLMLALGALQARRYAGTSSAVLATSSPGG